MRRLLLVALTLLLAVPAAAGAEGPPRQASIVPGKSIAGVEIGQRARIPKSNDRMHGPVAGDWGRADRGYCFLRLQCAWSVPGGGSAYVDIGEEGSRKVFAVATTAPNWVTATGAHVGASANRIRRDYPDAITRRICLEGDYRAVLLPSGRRTTIFRLEAGKVDEVEITPLTVEDLTVPC